jgi:YcaO-like protein with predicted kinase domain
MDEVLRGVSTPTDGFKLYKDGTHRIVDPEETLRRVQPYQRRIGITRLANLTGLDTIGIPVTAAYRPNSRSISVFQGKGTTLAAAKASAVMEAAEAWHAEQIVGSDIRGRYCDLVTQGLDAVDPARLPRARDAKIDVTAAEFRWVPGHDLFTGTCRWVPLDVISADYTVGGPTVGPLQATTSGLAAGNDLWEALSHALCETIERDAIALWRLLPDDTQDATTLDLTTADAAVHVSLLEKFAASGVILRAFDVTSDIRVATVLCLVGPAGHDDDIQPELGSGCHPDPMVALSRAVSEAAQARLTRIAGARDDLLPESYDVVTRKIRAQTARAWLGTARPDGGGRDCRNMPACAGSTVRGDLAAMLGCLSAAGFDEATWVDLTHPEIGIPVVRIVVPGLEGPPAAAVGGGYVPGKRAHLRQYRSS